MSNLPLNAFTLIVTTLAAWQLTALLFYDRGPYRLLALTREMLKRTPLARLTMCFYCMAVWVSAAVVLAAYPLSRYTIFLALAVGGAVSLVEMRLGRGGKAQPHGMKEPPEPPKTNGVAANGSALNGTSAAVATASAASARL